MNRSLKRVALVLSTACLSLSTAARAQDHPEGPPAQHIIQFAGHVGVGADGNGAVSATFPTTVEGDAVRYFLAVQNGCSNEPAPDPNQPPPLRTEDRPPCPPPVRAIQVALNNDVVFAKGDGDGFEHARVEIALNKVGGDANRITVTAAGDGGSGARFAVVAVRPAIIPWGGRSILPFAWTNELTKTFLTIHNAGPARPHVRLAFYLNDGTLVGKSAAREMAAHATVNLDLLAVARNLGLTWTSGPVEVEWGSLGYTRLSTVATEVHREPDELGNLEVTNARELALDDYFHPLNREQLRDIIEGRN